LLLFLGEIHAMSKKYKYHGRYYSFTEESPEYSSQIFRFWENDSGNSVRNEKRLRKLNALADHDRDSDKESVGGHLYANVDSKPRRKGQKGWRADALKKTGQDTHGRLWIFDDASKEGGRFWIKFGLFKAKVPELVNLDIVATTNKPKHLLGKKEMSVIIKKFAKMYVRIWGFKSLMRIILPLAGGKSDDK
jgi:hypothetical protein